MARKPQSAGGQMMDVLIPTVHLNGTDPKSLLDDLRNAIAVLREAEGMLERCTPHDRDYYPQGAFAGAKARVDHLFRLARVRHNIDELERIREGVQAQADEREERRVAA